MITFFKNRSGQFWFSLAAAILLFGMLGSKGIWTQEYRWQQICLHMLKSGDYWHPYLDGKPYYDKPLLSYWLIIFFAKLLHYENLTNALLRLPSTLSACLVLWSTYQLTKKYFDEKTALLSAWMLLTTFYFVFWAKVASADMLNLAGILLSLVWFLQQPSQRNFWRDLVFFLLLSISALLKGLIAPALVFVILLPHLYQQKCWLGFLSWKSLLAMLIAGCVYLAPFIISSHTSMTYTENGLVEVFRENILRFFMPFDHKGAWYTYIIYFPIYTLLWTPLVIVALVKYWRQGFAFLNEGERFFLWAVISIFVFLSLSGSRRSYYILPIVPFAIILASAYWQRQYANHPRAKKWMHYVIMSFYSLLCLYFLGFQPWYYH